MTIIGAVSDTPLNASSPYVGPGDGSRVLVIDDEEVIGMVMVSTLEEEFSVAVAHSGQEALGILENFPPEIVLLDKNLPDISGLELLKIIKARWAEIEVILITAYASLESAVEALRLGASDYLVKPFPHVQIVTEKIRWARNRHRLLRDRMDLVNRLLQINEKLRQTADALKDSEERFHSLFNAYPALVLLTIIRPDGRVGAILEANQRACDILERPADELRLRTLDDLVPSEARGQLVQEIERMGTEGSGVFSIPLAPKDAVVVPMDVHACRFQHNADSLLLFVAQPTP